MKNLKMQEEIISNWKGDIAKPVVSAICSAYNHEAYIADAIEGFLMQETDFPFEIIIHDDASTDKTAAIIREYEAIYPKLIRAVYQTENRFSQGKRNGEILYPMSKGKYVALCDGDDYWTDPSKLQKQVDFLKKENDFSMCYTGATVIFNDQVQIKNKNFGDSSQEDLIAGRGNAITGSVMFRKFDWFEWAQLDIVNGDVLLWHFLGSYGQCKYLEDIDNTVYRIHQGGVWSGRSVTSRLVENLKSYQVIRRRILKHYFDNEYILKKHDEIYPIIFINFFTESGKRLNIANLVFGVKEINKLVFLTKKRVFYVFVIHILRSIYLFFGLDKVKKFLKKEWG